MLYVLTVIRRVLFCKPQHDTDLSLNNIIMLHLQTDQRCSIYRIGAKREYVGKGAYTATPKKKYNIVIKYHCFIASRLQLLSSILINKKEIFVCVRKRSIRP